MFGVVGNECGVEKAELKSGSRGRQTDRESRSNNLVRPIPKASSVG
jgi:hypothetical protein